MPDNIVKHVCKYNYEECKVCKTLKGLKGIVYDGSMSPNADFCDSGNPFKVQKDLEIV